MKDFAKKNQSGSQLGEVYNPAYRTTTSSKAYFKISVFLGEMKSRG